MVLCGAINLRRPPSYMNPDDEFSLPLPLDRPLAVLDLETTGLRIGRDRIVELAVLTLEPSGEVWEKVRRFNPEMPIPPEASAVHGIGDEDVADKPPFQARARSLADLLQPCDLAGFNIRRFDLPMLLAEFRRVGVSFDPSDRRIIDVQTIFHREEPRDLSAAARFYLDREHAEAHSALGDIRTTAEVLSAQLQRYPHLPRDLDALHEYCDEVRPFETELDRWFARGNDGGLTFRKGKHRGRLLSAVARNEPDYLRWMLSLEDLDSEVQDAVGQALQEASS